MKAFHKENSLFLWAKIPLALALVSLLAACGNNKPFDSTAWQQGDLRTRGRMAEDIIKRKVLIGQPADGLQRLLGPPDKVYASALVYNMDLGWPFKDPSHYGLVVHLDADRKVRETRIMD
jgi:hypothetical protein